MATSRASETFTKRGWVSQALDPSSELRGADLAKRIADFIHEIGVRFVT
jgi:hypothetical protein